jgi:hypothetical protein
LIWLSLARSRNSSGKYEHNSCHNIANHTRLVSGTNLPPIWLYVRSESVQSKAQVGHEANQDVMNKLMRTLQQSSHTQPLDPANINNTSPIPASSQVSHIASKSVDLCTVACVCSHFRSKMSSQAAYQKEHCFGYLQSPCRSRYLYFGPSTPGSVRLSSPARTSTEEVTALKDIIEQPQPTRLQFLHQYQLALRIARSVLQFHNTAWLPAMWKLGDLAIVGSNISDHSLSTLHLSTRFETTTSADNTQSNIEAITDTVLLEIAHWQTFEQMHNGEPYEHAAHRIVRGPSPLGPRYRKIAERCLRCEFGAKSDDLVDVELQRAVWSKVVYPLEALVREISREA